MKPHTTFAALAIAAASITGTLALTAQGNGTAAAQASADATKVATIDIRALLTSLDERDDQIMRMEKAAESRRTEIEDVNNRLKTIQGDLEQMKKGTEQYREKVRQFRESSALLEARVKVLEQIMSIESAQLLRDLYAKVDDTIKKIAERDGYDLVILDRSGVQIPEGDLSEQQVSEVILARTVVYAGPKVNITDQVVSVMNNEYRAAKP